MKIIARKILDYPFRAVSGDTMNLSYTNALGEKTPVLSAPIERAATYVEAVIFEDEFEGRAALGGMFVEQGASD